MSNVKTKATYPQGGTGLDTLGSPNQVLRTNSGGTALEWATTTAGMYPLGDGSDGAATISGNTTLTSDKYYTSPNRIGNLVPSDVGLDFLDFCFFWFVFFMR